MTGKREGNLCRYKLLSAFTLVELLVVISIIALLLSILMPSLQRARAQAKKVVCQSNLRQLNLGLTLYNEDYGRLPNAERNLIAEGYNANNMPVPPDGWWYTDPGTNRPVPFPPFGGTGYSWYWQQMAGNYLGEQWDVYRCPASNRLPAAHDTGRKDSPYAGNYGCNRNLMPMPAGSVYAGQPPRPDISSKSIVQIKRPSDVALVFDCGSSVLEHSSAVTPRGFRWYIPGYWNNENGPFGTYDWHPGYDSDADKGRHPGATINIGWVDGHVGSMKADEFVDSPQWRTYWYE